MKKINFFAGPAILAEKVLEQSQNAIINFENMGLSILEISHRSKQFVSVVDEARTLVKELLKIDDRYAVLFLSGGASSQFLMSAMNLLNDDDKAAFVDTGTWSSKSIKEANLFGNIDVVASSKDQGYKSIPKNIQVDSQHRYLHITTNNTIFGTQFHEIPKVNIPIVADMSSDIFSRPIDINQYDIIYAGAQKNLGPAGTTLVIVKKDIVNKVSRSLPSMLDYGIHIDKGSMFNTPPVFPIYVSLLSLRWLKEQGGVEGIQEINEIKAKLLYNEIDRNPLFEGSVNVEDRSLMNVCFKSNGTFEDAEFISFAEENNCVGLKGHRSVGGFRASIYNAMSIEGVETLTKVMQGFEKPDHNIWRKPGNKQ